MQVSMARRFVIGLKQEKSARSKSDRSGVLNPKRWRTSSRHVVLERQHKLKGGFEPPFFLRRSENLREGGVDLRPVLLILTCLKVAQRSF